MTSKNLYIGLMSGTSADGLDAVLVDLSGERPALLHRSCTDFDDAMRADMASLRRASADEIERLGRLDRRLGERCAEAVNDLLRQATEAERGAVCGIGWAGHTIRHAPESQPPFTMQTGDAATIAHLTGLPVVAEFRRCDVAAGGQGAPLAPMFHRAFFGAEGEDRVVLNLGGIANLSLLGGDGSVAGFDTGPASCLMDEWIMRHLHKTYDRNGDWARSGTCVPGLLDELLGEPWLALPPPKSTGRELFNLDWLDSMLAHSALTTADMRDLLALENVQATLLAFSVATIRNHIVAYIPDCKQLVLAGGGAYNLYLREQLEEALPEVEVTDSSALGVPPEWVEAAGIAWLAQQRLTGRGLDMGSVTGGNYRNLGVVFE